ncbi:MAG: serine/threonine-protein phosphatase [Burkholderiales bacterium]|nr:serine/threonine-protein phosphatase [Burkholderiales bacterium]
MKMFESTVFRQQGSESGAVSLQVNVGHASEACAGRPNADFFGSVHPDDDRLQSKGILLAIADGLSDARGASESLVYSLLTDYYATSARVEVRQALSKVISATNLWMCAQSQHSDEGMLSTLSALALVGDRYHVAHVGDTRIYHLRGERFRQITKDHVWPVRTMNHILRRAVGLEEHLVIDFLEGEIEPCDMFLMVSDGVWEVLGDRALRAALFECANPQAAADKLVQESILTQNQYLGLNDATAAVVLVEGCG